MLHICFWDNSRYGSFYRSHRDWGYGDLVVSVNVRFDVVDDRVSHGKGKMLSKQLYVCFI